MKYTQKKKNWNMEGYQFVRESFLVMPMSETVMETNNKNKHKNHEK